MGCEEGEDWILKKVSVSLSLNHYTMFWNIFSLTVGVVMTLFGITWQKIVNYAKRFNKPIDLSYQNDAFAEDTIKYRFRGILYDINDTYEDAAVSLGEEKIERPFDFDEYYSKESPFYIPKYSRLTDNKEDEKLLKLFFDKYSKAYTNNRDFLENAPFIDVEHAFYFYILDKLSGQPANVKSYMCDGTNGYFDPYKLTKKSSIKKDISGIHLLPKKNSRILDALDYVILLQSGNTSKGTKSDLIEDIITQTLNANSYDLSQLRGMGWHEARVEESGARAFLNYLLESERGTNRTVNYLVDNAGVEFFSDLVLGYALLKHDELRIGNIIFHVNCLPIYVSDVIPSDFQYTFETVKQCILEEKSIDQKKYLGALEELRSSFSEKENVRADFIWNMPTSYEDISRSRDIFTNSDSVLIVKGDLNYRRLCKDKTWHYSKSLNKLTQYINAPTLVIRSFKSNVILDYNKNRIEENDKRDKDWRTNGKYGVISFMRKNG